MELMIWTFKRVILKGSIDETSIKYNAAEINILQAQNEAVRESALILALKYREYAKDLVRKMSHDEL